MAARELAAIAPRRALSTIADVLDQGSDSLRRELRTALAVASRSKRARAAAVRLLSGASFQGRSLVTRIDLLRALGDRLASLPPAGAALEQILSSDGSFRTRYLLQLPAGVLAKAGQPSALRFVRESLLSDKSEHIRTQAARASAGIKALISPLGQALGDSAPRVRSAALAALAESSVAGTKLPLPIETRVSVLLAQDKWTFVQVDAAQALGALPRRDATDQALITVLQDRSSLVRAAALRALGSRKSLFAGEEVHDVADDPQELTDVRVAAIVALGEMCRRESASLLYKLALRTGAPQLPYDQPLGLAALAALGDIKQPDLQRKLAPLLSKSRRIPPLVRSIVRDVLQREGSCRAP